MEVENARMLRDTKIDQAVWKFYRQKSNEGMRNWDHERSLYEENSVNSREDLEAESAKPVGALVSFVRTKESQENFIKSVKLFEKRTNCRKRCALQKVWYKIRIRESNIKDQKEQKIIINAKRVSLF